MSRTTAFTLSVTLALAGGVSSTDPSTTPPPATENAYYVATNGSDSNPGTKSNPFRTLKKALTVLKAGYTLYLRAGTYNETIDTLSTPITGGTSFSNGPVIAGYPGERPVIMGDGTGATDFIVRLGQYKDTLSPYVTFRNIVIDGSAPRGPGPLLTISADFQRFDNVEIRNSLSEPYKSILIFITDSANGTEFLNCSIHDASFLPGVNSGYGVYLTGTNTIFDNCDIYNNGGYALHIFDSGSSSVSGNIVRNSRIWGNNVGAIVPHQVILSSGSNNQIYNTIIHSPAATTGGVQIDYGCTDCKVFNNTIYSHSSSGVAISSSKNTIVKDNRFYQNNPDVIDNGIGTIMFNNLTSPP